MKIAILYSGGLDSFLMYKYAQKHYPNAEIKCVFYAHGQDSMQAEIDTLPDWVDVRNIDWLGDNIKPIAKTSDPFAGNIYIPGRNLIFSALAACQELADEIWMGTVWDEDNDQATDKNEKFRNDASNLISYVLSPFNNGTKIRFPFVEEEWTKEQAVRWAISEGVTPEELKRTVSCWHQTEGKPCGECKQCSKRMLVFGLNGFTEDYIVHPTKSPTQQQNMMEYVETYISSTKELNRDELNMVDMLYRYFYPLESTDPWIINMQSKLQLTKRL